MIKFDILGEDIKTYIGSLLKWVHHYSDDNEAWLEYRFGIGGKTLGLENLRFGDETLDLGVKL